MLQCEQHGSDASTHEMTFVFQRKGELTNKRDKLPLKKQSLRKWPLYDGNRRVDSNFTQHPQSIPCTLLLYEQSVALDKKQTLYFAARSIGRAETVCILCSMESFLRCLCCGEMTPCPAWQRSDFCTSSHMTEEEKSFPSWPNQSHTSKAVGLIKASWLLQRLEESDEVDGVLQQRVPLNCSGRRITPVLFTNAQRFPT